MQFQRQAFLRCGRCQSFMGIDRQVELLVELAAERFDAVSLQRQPDSQTAKRSRLFRGKVAGVDTVVVRFGRHVAAAQIEGTLQSLHVANEQASGPVRQKQTLVRVDGDRIGSFDSRHPNATAVGQQKETAVGRIDMPVEPFATSHLGRGGQIVERAGVGRTGVRDEQKRNPPRRSIRRDRIEQRRFDHPAGRIGRNRADMLGAQAGVNRRFGDRVMRLVRNVERSERYPIAETMVSGVDDRRQIRDRTSRSQIASGPLAITDERTEPGEDRLVDPRQTGGSSANADIAIDDVGDQVRQRRIGEPASRNERQVARSGCVEPGGNRNVEEHLDQTVERGRAVGPTRVVEQPQRLGIFRGVEAFAADRCRSGIATVEKGSQTSADQIERRQELLPARLERKRRVIGGGVHALFGSGRIGKTRASGRGASRADSTADSNSTAAIIRTVRQRIAE